MAAVFTDSNFDTEVLKADKLSVIDFWAPWCGPCRSLAPIVEDIASAYSDRIKFVNVNVDENPAVSEAFQVQSIPFMAVLKQRTVIDTAMGALPKHQLTEWLDTILDQLAKGLLDKAPEPTA